MLFLRRFSEIYQDFLGEDILSSHLFLDFRVFSVFRGCDLSFEGGHENPWYRLTHAPSFLQIRWIRQIRGAYLFRRLSARSSGVAADVDMRAGEFLLNIIQLQQHRFQFLIGEQMSIAGGVVIDVRDLLLSLFEIQRVIQITVV